MNKTTKGQYALNAQNLGKDLPSSPGVYLFKDSSGRVIYVGKAKSLKNRVISYFRFSGDPSSKVANMLNRAAEIDWILTSTENEAFILEGNLIKKYMPRYNVILRDDKRYPCLRLDVREAYPRLRIVRQIKKDGAIYYGPFSSSNAVRSTLKIIEKAFLLRKCKGKGIPKRSRPCLNYQMNLCLAPCVKDVSEIEYKVIVNQVRLFLEGRNLELLKRLQKNMKDAAEALDFERAALIRDQINSIEMTIEQQHVVSARLEDQDIIGLARDEGSYQISIMFVRKGSLLDNRNFFFRNPLGITSEIMEAFIKQYYSSGKFIPSQILISDTIDDHSGIMEWLSELVGKNIKIHCPQRGEKLKLVKLALKNAEMAIANSLKPDQLDLMKSAQQVFGLRERPRFIEGLDISNFQGDQAVGSIVSFVDGIPNPSGYRNYKIQYVEGVNDYGMMEELIQRRIGGEEPLPDIFLVDGGKGHLKIITRILEQVKPSFVPEVVSIAKADLTHHEKSDKIYLPGRKNPLTLKNNDPVLLLMMRVRDEVHRRAIGYHRKLRSKSMLASQLDQIPGIGKKRKQLLLKYFKDINTIRKADPVELSTISEINQSLAKKILFHLKSL